MVEFFKILVGFSTVLSTAAVFECYKGTQTGQGQRVDTSKMKTVGCCPKSHRCAREWTPSTETLKLGCVSDLAFWKNFKELFGAKSSNWNVRCAETTTWTDEPVTACLCDQNLCNDAVGGFVSTKWTIVVFVSIFIATIVTIG